MNCPIQTLMDAEGNIDSSRYPGFASLLDDFTWYRNAPPCTRTPPK